MNLKNKVALVTGAGGGIGRAAAIALARRGASVAVNYLHSREGAEAAVRDIEASGARGAAFGCDVTRGADVRSMVAQIERALGGIDILVNNAGDLVGRKTLAHVSEELYRQVMDVNVLTALLCSQAVVPGMAARGGGAIITISSLAAHNGGGPGAFLYAAAKAAIIALTKGLAKELAPKGIRVNCVSPGRIEAVEDSPERLQMLRRGRPDERVPLRRAGGVDDIADAIAALVSDDMRYVTGQTLHVNGGIFMG